MSKYKYCLFCFSLVFCLLSVAQQSESKINAHIYRLSEYKGEEKKEALYEISRYYLEKNLDSCRLFSTQLMALAQRGDAYSRFRAFKLMGQLQSELNVFDLSISYYKKAEQELFEVDNNELDVTSLFNDIGILFIRQERWSEAEVWLTKALKISQKHHESGEQMNGLLNLGRVYEATDRDSLAISSYLKFEKYLKIKSSSVEFLANLYNTIGSFYLDRNDLNASKAYFVKADSVYQFNGIVEYHANSITNLGILAFLEGDMDLAYDKFLAALKMRERFGRKKLISESYLNFGDFYSRQGKNELASAYFKDAYRIAIESKNIEAIRDASEYLVTMLRKSTNPDEVVNFLLEKEELLDELKTENLKLQIDDAIYFAKLDGNDQVIERHQLENSKSAQSSFWLIGAISISLIFLLAAAMLYFKSRKN